MKSGFTILAKLLAVCLFLGLLSGYVWYRQDQTKKQEAARLAAYNEARDQVLKIQQENADPDEVVIEGIDDIDAIIMSGSKSGMVFPSSKSGPALSLEELKKISPELFKELEQEMKDHPLVIPSSKSGRVVMPSSKSMKLVPATGLDEDARIEALRDTDPMLYQAIKEALKKGETRVVMPSSKSGMAIDIKELLKLRQQPEKPAPNGGNSDNADKAQPQKQQK